MICGCAAAGSQHASVRRGKSSSILIYPCLKQDKHMYCTLRQRRGEEKAEAWQGMKGPFKLNSEGFLSFFLFVSKAGMSGWCWALLGWVETSGSPDRQTAPNPSLSHKPPSTILPHPIKNDEAKVVITLDMDGRLSSRKLTLSHLSLCNHGKGKGLIKVHCGDSSWGNT